MQITLSPSCFLKRLICIDVNLFWTALWVPSETLLLTPIWCLVVQGVKVFWSASLYIPSVECAWAVKLKVKTWCQISSSLEGTTGCRYDNLLCRQWRLIWQHDNSRFSVQLTFVHIYRQISNIRRNYYQNLNVFRLVWKLPLPNLLKPGVNGAAPTGDAPTTAEWSTILLPTKVPLILEVWRYISVKIFISSVCFEHAAHYGDVFHVGTFSNFTDRYIVHISFWPDIKEIIKRLYNWHLCVEMSPHRRRLLTGRH